MKPSSQSTTKMTIMVQSMDIPFGSIESSSLVLWGGYLPGKPFQMTVEQLLSVTTHDRSTAEISDGAICHVSDSL